MSQLIWTRAMDDWEEDKKLLQKYGHDALHLPCITMQGLPVRFPKHKPQVFVFTSANAVRYTERHHALVNLMRLAEAVYAIGPGTQKALINLKVTVELCEGVHTAEQLSVWLSRNIAPETHVAWPTAREPSYNLAEHLARYRIHVDVLAVYHTEKALHLPNGKFISFQFLSRSLLSLGPNVLSALFVSKFEQAHS